MCKNTSPLWISLSMMIFLCRTTKVDAYVGLTWGRYATQKLVASMVVDLFLQNGIQELRLLQPSYHVLEAFSDTNIGIVITVQEIFLRRLKKNREMDEYIYERVKSYVNKGARFRYVYIGDEPFTKSNKRPNGGVFNETVYFLEMAQTCMDRHNLQHIKLTTPHFTDVLENLTKPSDAVFRHDIKLQMLDFLNFINKTGAPFIFNMYPIYTVYTMGYDVEFAFFDNKSEFKIVDGNNTYTNVFTFLYDALVCALTKVGYGDIDIVIGQIGWPTDGYRSASVENAERFHRGFLKYIASTEGTPLRPNRDISVYLFSLSDENKLVLDYGNFQRHFGIYKHDGTPKYKIDFSLQDREVEPTTARGTVNMPYRWCVFDGKTEHDEAEVLSHYDKACNVSDCSAMGDGATCDRLTFPQKVSYAYNMFYQQFNQQTIMCNFTGAYITPDDPSTPNCEFPIEILTAELMDGEDRMTKKW